MGDRFSGEERFIVSGWSSTHRAACSPSQGNGEIQGQSVEPTSYIPSDKRTHSKYFVLILFFLSLVIYTKRGKSVDKTYEARL